MLSNSGQNEYGGIYGGSPGDQTGREWNIVNWYSYPWKAVLRHPNENVRKKIAELARKAANNNRIGYNQYNRNSYWAQLQKAKYDPSKITVNCDADCSAGVIANVMACGYLLNIGALKNITATYTGNMRNAFYNAGFQILTESKYLRSPDYLLEGDILLNDTYHTCTNLDDGVKMSGKWVKKGGDWYYYSPDGIMKKNDWQRDTKGWCYLGSDGKAIKNTWLWWNGAWFYLKSDCRMLVNGWQQDSKGWCYVGSDGRAYKNKWIKWRGDWYYLKSDFRMAVNEFAKDSHGKCWLGPDGKWDWKYVDDPKK